MKTRVIVDLEHADPALVSRFIEGLYDEIHGHAIAYGLKTKVVQVETDGNTRLTEH